MTASPAPRRGHRRGVALAAASLLLLPACSDAQSRIPPGDRPNVVLILTDDVGYGDIGSYGARDIRTPAIDRLAQEGVRLTDFYAAPQCTPTRAALISGRYQQRIPLERALGSTGASLDMGLPATGRSLPRLLKDAGYATGLVGKWHLGYRPEFSPNAHGFDYFYGFLAGYVDFYHHTRGGDGREDLWENGVAVRDTGYMTDLITERAVRFVERSAGRPFFLEVAYNATHWPFQPPGRRSRAERNSAFQSPGDDPPATRADYIAMLEHADRGVATLMATLERLGVADRTLVIFTNDNGGEWLSNNAPLFHRKDTLWEGGIRVPAIFRWPGRLPAGTTSDLPGITMDLTATILGATGTPIPRNFEGRNLVPLLSDRSGTSVRAARERPLFWRIDVPVRQQRAVRRGQWKLLVDGDDLLLFDLTKDIGERQDVAFAHPQVVADLRGLLANWERDVDRESGRGR
jgi:arylsulfatase A-like enzyme